MDFMYTAVKAVKEDAGPPRFFCPPEAAPCPYKPPAKSNPIPRLFFLPGIDGTGLGLTLQHQSLARLFEITCLHIPPSDRTPFQGLVEIVEAELRWEQQQDPKRPLFLFGESFGCLLALAVAARNPDLPLHLVLANSATAFERSQLKPLLPLLQLAPSQLYRAIPVLLSTTMGDPLRMAAVGVPSDSNPLERGQQLAQNLLGMLPTLPLLGDLLPQATLSWKLELLAAGCRYTNPLISKVTAPTLILASGKDNMLPSAEEGKRLQRLLPNATLRNFADSGHTLLLEDGVDVAAVLKSTGVYRRAMGWKDPVTGFIPPSPEEVQRARAGLVQFVRTVSSPVSFSTAEDGTVQRGLANIRDVDRPLLFIGNHQTFAPDLGIVVDEVLRETGILIRGLAHPLALGQTAPPPPATAGGGGNSSSSSSSGDSPLGDFFRTFGAVPVSGNALYKLLATNDAALLYPGGVREAYRRKNEEYKLFWPDRAEFVRMAMRHGATIIPFACVGVDDAFQIVLDAPELQKLPIIGDRLMEGARNLPRARVEGTEGAAEELFIAPVAVPRRIQRLYLLFGKPIRLAGTRDQMNDKQRVGEIYGHVKAEVEAGLQYLLEKRKEDPYGDLVPRLLYEASWGGQRQAPTFEP